MSSEAFINERHQLATSFKIDMELSKYKKGDRIKIMTSLLPLCALKEQSCNFLTGYNCRIL